MEPVTTMHTKIFFATDRELAEMASNNAAKVFSRYGEVDKVEIIGSESFGFSINVVMNSITCPINLATFPSSVDGVPTNVTVKGSRSIAEHFFLPLNRDS